MGYHEDMERCRAYMEEHLSEEIDPRQLAKMLGYSFFHFCHVFRSCNGMAVCEYLRDRRLCRAAVSLAEGQSVTKSAFECGFETVSGFTRAFGRKFGIAPSQYKKTKGGLLKMTPEMKRVPAFKVIGYIFRSDAKIDPRQNGAYWLGQDFSSVTKEDYAGLTYPGYAEVGAWVSSREGDDELRYFLGPTVKDTGFIPAGMEVLDIPEAEYAVFTVPKAEDARGLHDAVNKTWKYIFDTWFDGSGYKFDHTKIDFEYYLGEDTYIYVPLMEA